MLIVATKAVGLEQALERVAGIGEPGLVLPLLNGLDHLAVLRRRFDPRGVLAGAIRVESDHPEAGVICTRAPFLLIDVAATIPPAAPPCRRWETSSSEPASRCGWATRSPTAPRPR